MAKGPVEEEEDGNEEDDAASIAIYFLPSSRVVFKQLRSSAACNILNEEMA